MFVLSLKASKKSIALFCAAFVAIIAAGTVLVSSAIGSALPANAGSKPAKLNLTAKNNADRIAFINYFGWETEEEPADILEVIIPAKFDEVYSSYNSIQKKQGFDLERYKGKRVKRYSYVVTNYPGTSDEIRINILVYGTKIIGGDVSSTKLNGFSHGFKAE